jgi:hypothetical protein
MSAVHTSAVLGRRTCAVLAATSAALHAVMLGHAGSPVTVVLMVAMIGACLCCARDLWRRSTLGVWCAVALMNLAMIALHIPPPGHHHGGHAAAQPSTLMTLTMLLAFTEVVVAAAVLYHRTRNRTVVSPP